MSDTWPDEMPARKRPFPLYDKEAGKRIAQESATGPLGPLDTMILGSKASVRIDIPLTDSQDAKRMLLVLRDAIEPLLANADRLAGERAKLFYLQSEVKALAMKLRAYRRRS